MQPRLLLADDHILVLEGLQKLLEPEFEIVGAVNNGRELLAVAPKEQPDVIVLDISMPLLNGLDAARQLKKMIPRVKLVMLTMHSDPVYVTECFRAGVSAYVLKNSAASELAHAIREVLNGRAYVTPMVTKDTIETLLRAFPKPRKSPLLLTPRQREVVQLVAEGHSTKEIAKILNISVKTVEFHKSGVFRSLGIRTTAELTKYALRHGIISA